MDNINEIKDEMSDVDKISRLLLKVHTLYNKIDILQRNFDTLQSENQQLFDENVELTEDYNDVFFDIQKLIKVLYPDFNETIIKYTLDDDNNLIVNGTYKFKLINVE